MSSGCGDVISLEDMKTAKKHQTFEAEVITGKEGGVSGGASITEAMNPVTGQVQKTLPAVLDDIALNAVPFSKQYPDLAAAQADIANIPDGSYTYVRSADDTALAVEYVNNGGTLQPTGRKMPSQNSVNQALIAAGQVATASSVRDNQLHGMSMQDRRTLAADFTQYLAVFSAGGSSVLNGSATYTERTLLSISSFSTSIATAACTLTITGAGRTLFKRGFFSGESLSDGVLTTPYFDVSLRQFTVESVSASEVNTWVLKGSIKLPKPYSSSEGRVLRDRENSIAIGVSSSVYTYTGDTLAFDAANALLYVAVSRSAMASAGYDDTTDGAQNYFWDTYGGLILSQQSTESQTLPEYTLFFSEAGEVSVITDQNCAATIQVTKKLVIDEAKALAVSNAAQLTILRSNDAAENLRQVSSERALYSSHIADIAAFSSVLSWQASLPGDAVLKIASLTPSANVSRSVITITDGAGTATSLTMLQYEAVSGGVLSSPYKDFIFKPGVFSQLGIGATMSTVKIDVSLPGSLPADTTRIIRDRSGTLAPYLPTTIYGANVPGITWEMASGKLILAVSNTAVVAAGFSLNVAGVVAFIIKTYTGMVLSQLTADTVRNPFCNVIKVLAGAISVTSDTAVDITGSITGQKVSSGIRGAYRRYTVQVKNNLSYDINSAPVSIKCSFPAGEVLNDQCLIVEDEEGVQYPCQWSGEEDFNRRRGLNIGYWGDGSLRAGELIIIDSIPAKSAKKYIVRSYADQQDFSLFSHAVRGTNTALTVTADNGTQVIFDSVVGWLPYRIVSGGITYTNICQQVLIRNSGSTRTYFECGHADASYKIISDGAVFTEIETTFSNAVFTDYPEFNQKFLNFRYRTKVFKTGYIRIEGAARVAIALPENTLYGCMARLQLTSSASKDARTGYNSLWTDNGIKRSLSLLYANGDVQRDSAEVGTLQQRPSVNGITANGTYSRLDGGWWISPSSTTTLGAPVDWTWTNGFSINMNENSADSTELSNRELNPLTGFASGESGFSRLRQSRLMSRLGDIICGISMWNDLDATSVDNGNGMFNTITGDIVRMLSKRVGSFESVYAKFSAWALAHYGGSGIASIKLDSASASKSLQFASRLVLPQLWWLYKLAVLNNDTAKQTELKVAIDRIASDCYNYYGPSATNVNSNFYGASYRAWAMAIAAGLDASGNYASAMSVVESKYADHTETGFAGVENIITDNVNENVAGMRYLSYQIYSYNNYLIGCRIAGRTPVFDMMTYILGAVSAYGGLKEIDYCVAESRRGTPCTVAFILYPLLMAKDASALEAAERLLNAFDEYGGSNTDGQIKLWDLDFYSVISTTFSEYTFTGNVMADTWMQWWFDNNA